MKVVLQRVKSAYVKVDSDVISEIDNGYLLLWGIEEADSEVESEILINKILNFRVFSDENLKMNKALKILTEKKLGILVVLNNKDKTVGIITDGQIRRFTEKKFDFRLLSVKKIMTKKPIFIDKDELGPIWPPWVPRKILGFPRKILGFPTNF